MKKGGFNMYLTKEKPYTSLYRNYNQKLLKQKEVEIQVYISHEVGHDMSRKMESVIRCMTAMLVQGFSKGGIEVGTK